MLKTQQTTLNDIQIRQIEECLLDAQTALLLMKANTIDLKQLAQMEIVAESLFSISRELEIEGLREWGDGYRAMMAEFII